MRKPLFLLYKLVINRLLQHRIGNSYSVRVLDKFLNSRLNPGVAEVQGHTLFLDSRDSLFLSVYGVYEPFETELFKQRIEEGDVVLDIGANIGHHTLTFAKCVGENGRVFAFEADPENFRLLERNVRVNGYDNVVLVRKAVSNETGTAELHLCEYNRGMHSMFESPRTQHSIQVETIRLDDYFQDKPLEFDFIKMDIEGAEADAIQGMPSLLSRSRNVEILVEFAPMRIIESGSEPPKFLDLILEHGFEIHRIDSQRKELRPVDAHELLKDYTPEKGNMTNLLCIRRN